jgi:hypothetical protein
MYVGAKYLCNEQAVVVSEGECGCGGGGGSGTIGKDGKGKVGHHPLPVRPQFRAENVLLLQT